MQSSLGKKVWFLRQLLSWLLYGSWADSSVSLLALVRTLTHPLRMLLTHSQLFSRINWRPSSRNWLLDYHKTKLLLSELGVCVASYNNMIITLQQCNGHLPTTRSTPTPSHCCILGEYKPRLSDGRSSWRFSNLLWTVSVSFLSFLRAFHADQPKGLWRTTISRRELLADPRKRKRLLSKRIEYDVNIPPTNLHLRAYISYLTNIDTSTP